MKETPVDPSIFDRRDPLEKYLDRQKLSKEKLTSYEEAIEASENERLIDITGMSLDEYLTKYTSEDNQSFQEINQKDRD